MDICDVVQWLKMEAKAKLGDGRDMGCLEKAVEAASRECRRLVLEKLTQEVAANVPLCCPQCGCGLKIEAHRRSRTVVSEVGSVDFIRSYGFCVKCAERYYPADAALGLATRAPASPRVQEICALMALRAPAGRVEQDLRRLTCLDLDPSTVHREARRQGVRSLAIRDADEAMSTTSEGVAELAARASVPKAPFTLVIEIDAWNIRERDQWGDTERRRKTGEEITRWHWVYTATVFRLDQRGTTRTGRAVIAERGFVATRKGVERFTQQLYTETLQRGLLSAEHVLVLADGAVWIWNLVNDRFSDAQQRVDLFHVKEHLWSLAHELHGQGTEAAQLWVRPYLNWLDRRGDGALDMISSLENFRATVQGMTKKQREALDREIGYFDGHRTRMDYKAAKSCGQPVGSGAIESTASQYQRRFKLTGQFWTLEGDEQFLALYTIHLNNRWHRLFSHDRID